MGKASDTKGKAFEYKLSLTLYEYFKLYGYTVNLTQDFVQCQNIDTVKFSSLPTEEENYFTFQCKLISEWFIKLFSLSDESSVTLNRLSDSKGTKGNPTDIEVISNLKQINISAKHNNFSMKHQRLPSLFQQLGFSKKKQNDTHYRENLKKISNEFYSFSNSLVHDFKSFSEIKKFVPNSINDQLYEPSLDLYCNTLEIYQNSVPEVQNFFNFLLGRIDFYHVKMDSKKVVIKNYSSINRPSSFYLSKINKSNQVIYFDNGFSFNFRIHTASSRIEKCSNNCCDMKIDTTILKEPLVPEFTL